MVLVDANVLLDVLNPGSIWGAWSRQQIEDRGSSDVLAINPLIYAEIAGGYLRRALLDEALGGLVVRRLDLPYEAAFLAGQVYRTYVKNGGDKRSPMPDFYIGAHAQVAGMSLLTRDLRRYRTYFPDVQLITPPPSA